MNPSEKEDELLLMWQKLLKKKKKNLQSINERFVKFEQSFQSLIAGQQALTERVCNMEEQAEDHEQHISDVETSLAGLWQENWAFRSKLLDLEEGSRRNIKIICIPEGEEKGRPMELVSQLIPKLLGMEMFVRQPGGN